MMIEILPNLNHGCSYLSLAKGKIFSYLNQIYFVKIKNGGGVNG
jgi:hypothetical protein